MQSNVIVLTTKPYNHRQIIELFLIRRISGVACRSIMVWVRWEYIYTGLANRGSEPCWVEVYRIRQYVAHINDVMAIGTAIQVEIERIDVSNIISLRRLIDGGAPRLAARRMNHHRVMAGNKDRRPFVRNSLRVCVVS